MDYNVVIDYLFSQLANYQNSGGNAYKPGLDKIKKLLSLISNPHLGQKFIHVAGTNGKGSVSHILASVLIENGYKVGLFTSPHIKDFRERIKINGRLISKTQVVDFVNTNKTIIDDLNPSFFEICTALAFDSFAKQNCDISIIETGLGGRLDSTNVVLPVVSIITNISLDHVDFLGDNKKDIAKEKAGIIKPKVPVVIGEYDQETFEVFEQVAQKNQSKLLLTKTGKSLPTDITGEFQQINITTALNAIEQLKLIGWHIDDDKTLFSLKRIKKNTNFIGRLEQIESYPHVFVDASHNIGGIENLFKEIENIPHDKLHCVYGTSSDKDVDSIFKVFPKKAQFYLTEFESARSMRKEQLKHFAKLNSLSFVTYDSSKQALNDAKNNAAKNDLIIVFGSFFLLEKII